RVGDCQSQRLGGGEVNNEIKHCRLLDRDVGGLRPSQNVVDQLGGTPEQVRDVWSVEHQTSHYDVLPEAVMIQQFANTCDRRPSCCLAQSILVSVNSYAGRGLHPNQACTLLLQDWWVSHNRFKVNNWVRELGNIGATAAEARNFGKCVFHRFCRSDG